MFPEGEARRKLFRVLGSKRVETLRGNEAFPAREAHREFEFWCLKTFEILEEMTDSVRLDQARPGRYGRTGQGCAL